MIDLETPTGLRLSTEDGALHLGTAEARSWLGPGRVRGGVQLGAEEVDGAAVLTLSIGHRARSVATSGGYADVGAGVAFTPHERREGDRPTGLRAFGHQYTEFGLPTHASEDLARWFLLPFRPPVVLPLWLCAPSGPTLLLAPLDAFHDQVLTVPAGESTGDPTLVWGLHGDLDEVPASSTASLYVGCGDSPRTLLEDWVGRLEVAPRLPVDHDTLGHQVSYWTDNGAAYWYRTEPPRSVPDTVGDAVASVTDAGVAVGAVQIDSWFYPQEISRPFDTDEWEVPPTGLLDWAPRPDILPDGIASIRDRVGGRPLVAHCRHLAATSPLAERFDHWRDGGYAHPTGDDYYEELLDRAASWGVETFEHDWLVECFTGVRGLRAGVGRARRWQEGIDRAAADRDMTLQWCMATPADFFQTATLGRVTSIRTSGDHGYLVGPGFLWAWFCYTNALARALGLAPFKDVFHSGGEHAGVEALLSALSTGPVGLGDAIGTTDASVVAATCRRDGVIVRPDVPIAAVDACYRQHAVARPVPLVAECHTDHPAGRWVQVFTANTYREDEPIDGRVDLGPAWPTRAVVALDLRTGAVSHPDDGWDVALEPAEWTHHLLAPVLDGIAVFGDVTKHAPVGRAQITSIDQTDDGVTVTVTDADGPIRIAGWSNRSIDATIDGAHVALDREQERWSVVVAPGTTLLLSG